MKNPVDLISKAIKRYPEPVPLHSGRMSRWKLDVLELGPQFLDFMLALNPQYQVVGIELGGAILARVFSGRAGIVRKEINGGTVYVPETALISPKGRVSLIDDVVA